MATISPVIPRQLSFKPVDGGDLRWVSMTSGSPLPDGAVVGGFEEGELLYVARARHNRSMCPGKYVPSDKHAYVAWGHVAHKKERFEVLCGFNLLWVPTRGDVLPPGAFPGGLAPETGNEELYIGRAPVEASLVPGKVHMHYKTCYLPYKEREREVHTFEVLVTPDDRLRCWKLPNRYSDSED